MSDRVIRTALIRLAKSHPEFRAKLLPLIKEADFDASTINEEVSGPEGLPGSDAQKPWAKGEFTQQEGSELLTKVEGGGLGKAASDDAALRSNLIRLASAHPEFRSDILGLLKSAGHDEEGSTRTAGQVLIRRMMSIAVRILTTRDLGGSVKHITGQMSFAIGNGAQGSLRFEAHVAPRAEEGRWEVQAFAPLRALSGAGAEFFIETFQGVLQEAFDAKGIQLFGDIPAV